MPSPPLSPKPQRWRAHTDEPHPDIQALLSTFDTSTSTAGGHFVDTRSEPGHERRVASADEGHRRAESDIIVPEIRTTSPDNGRPRSPSLISDKSTERSLSPLEPPTRGQIFGQSAQDTAGRAGLARGLSVSGPRLNPTAVASNSPNRSDSIRSVRPQETGQSNNTLDAAYDNVFSTLDLLGNTSSLSLHDPAAAAAAHTSRPSSASSVSSLSSGLPAARPSVDLFTPREPDPAPPSTTAPRGRMYTGEGAFDKLDVVSEKTEPSSPAGSVRSSPISFRRPASGGGSRFGAPDASRYPLPPSPVKTAEGTPTVGQASPTKASALIKMFENKSGGSPQPQSQAQPPPPPPPVFSKATQGWVSQPVRPPETSAPPPSSYRSPMTHLTDVSSPSASYATPLAQSPPPKPASPLSSVKTLIASWKARSGSPTQRVMGSPGHGASAPGLFGRDRGWNVSIRRRRRNEAQEGAGLAEQAVEDSTHLEPLPGMIEAFDAAIAEEEAFLQEEGGSRQRTPSVRSSRSRASTAPRQLTGEPLRIGNLYYLNVHDGTTAPFYEWIQTDARLFPEGLQLSWRLPSGSQAMVTLDLEYCEEVASTYSPNNPAARDDLGTIAAQRQGDLADNLYPFKLVYDDGTERLACDSARDRVRWVNAIWSALERTRHRSGPRPHSMRSERPPSLVSRSEGGGSASTQYTPIAGGPTRSGSTDPLPAQAPPMPLYTTDDQVIITSGGFAAPLVHRDSRRLTAGGPDRTRSLRRVASEADLSESAQPAAHEPDRRSVPDILNVPLTIDAARSRPGSRDFTFAGGVAPPSIVTSPPPEYSSPIRTQPLDTIPESSSQTMATAAEILASTAPVSSYRTPYDAESAYFTTARPSDTHSHSRAFTATEGRPNSMHAAHQDSGQTSGPKAASIPYVEVTGATPSGSSGSDPQPVRSTIYTMANEPFATAPQSHSDSRYSTARQSAYSTAMTQLGDGTWHTAPRDSVSSYHSAPPPVPTKYGTASERSEDEDDAPIRYQLYDREVPWATASQGRSTTGDNHYLSARPPTSRMTTAETHMSSAYLTAATSSSPRSSAYGSAPPPPISRSSSGTEKLSYRSDIQDRAETATHISEPESDVGLLADLERRSSFGSMAPDAAARQSLKTKTYYTANPSVGTARTPLGTAQMNTMYETARDSAYTTAPTWTTPATTAQGTQQSYFTARTSQTPIREPSAPSSISTAQSVVSSKIKRVPVPPMPPSPPGPSSGSVVGTSTSDSSTVRPDFGHDVNRMLNYIQGQDTAGQGERSRIASQLDRMEGKLDRLVYDRPPPLPSKGDSPPGSPSSVSSTSTARPVTPPLMPDAVAQQLDDMRRLLGTVIGQNNDILQARRSYDVDLPPTGPGFRRLEDLLRRALYRLGDSDIMEEDGLDKYPDDLAALRVPSTPGKEGSWYRGGGSVYSSEFDPKYRGPNGSMTSEQQKRLRGQATPVPSELLDPYVASPEFDDGWAIHNLPPETPPSDYVAPKTMLPPHLADHLRQQRPQPQQQPPAPRAESVYTEEVFPSEPQVPETPKDQTPIPYHPPIQEQDDVSTYSEDDQGRGPSHRLPPPQPVDLPTPVGSKENFHMGASGPGPAIRPSFPDTAGMGGMPPPPGIAEMPRPSLPRIAGVRDPISTTYFRRGFPPPGPMGPMGMFPGPMGIPGPGMGPFMPGLRPGLAGFGGPIGPNVGPGPRRPGFFPPGVSGTSGDYGLPAASRYGPAGPARPTAGPDTGLGNTTDESTTPTTTEEVLVTPFVPEKTLEPHIHTPSGETDDSFRRALGNSTDLAQAQGEQQNEISRFLHGMSDQIEDARRNQNADLANLLADVARLRSELQPKHVTGHVLPDGRVVLANGDVVQGVRGVAQPGLTVPSAPLPVSGGAVHGTILPDGRIMADGKIIDGIMAAPSPSTPIDPQVVKDSEQDRKLADLQAKIESLMNPAVKEKSDVKEHQVVSGPGGVKEIDREQEIERNVTGPAAGTSPTTAGTVSAVEETVETAPAASVPAPATTRVNPRTGKPLSIPQPLSLTPHDMSPIQTPADAPGGQLIREEHEEIVQRPGGGPPVVTKSTTRTYTQPNGKKVTVADPSVIPPSTAGDPVARDFANVPTAPATGAQFSDQQSVVEGPAATRPPATKQTSEVIESDPGNVPVDTKTTTVSKTSGAPGGAAPPPATAANVPGAGKPGKAGKPPKDAPVWDTNHPKPITTSNNVPNAPSAPSPGPPAGAAGPPPVLVEADPGNAPAAPAGAPAGAPGAVGPPPPAIAATPAPVAAGGKVGVGKFRWDPHLPTQARPDAPKPGKPADPAKPPAAQKLGNQPTLAAPPPGASGAPGAAPPTQLANVPDAGGQPGQPGAAVPPVTTVSNVPNAPDQPVWDTNHPKPGVTPGGGGGSGVLSKLKPQKSQEKISTVSTGPSGPPIVTSTTPPAGAGGKQTRFSDTAHAAPPGETVVSNVPSEEGPGATVVSAPPGGGAPGSTVVDTSGPNKLRKGKPAVHQDGHTGVPGIGPGTVVATPGGGPSGTPPPVVSQSTPAPAGTPASTKVKPATTPGGATVVPTPSGTPAPAANVVTPETLEEVVLPDGRTAYVRPTPAAPTGKKGKTTDETTTKTTTKTTGGVPAESAMGQGHCSVCCPSAPRTTQGVPIESCAHQDGPLGASGPSSSKDKKKVTQGGAPTVPAHPAGPLNLPGETAVTVEEDRATAPDGSNKLKKKVTAGPAVPGGPSLSPEERAMEDARNLATKQKAAKELSDKEAGDIAARNKAKADKIKLAEDRHKENAMALANLQKALDAIAADSKAKGTAQDKRRVDKTARDKKLQDALDGLVKDRDEAKKRQAADDKKPGTQAVLDALKTSGDGQAAFLRKLATEIMEQNSNQHKGTQQAAQNAAREQVGFNLAGYLDDFSKALSGEVRSLLKEVGDLRENRRALYMELADLLLMKGRQSGGDLMAILPYPTQVPKRPGATVKKDPPKPPGGGGGGGGGAAGGAKAPAGVPAWSSFMPPAAPVMGMPNRPLPTPAPPAGLNFVPGAVPPPPPANTRPLPQV